MFKFNIKQFWLILQTHPQSTEIKFRLSSILTFLSYCDDVTPSVLHPWKYTNTVIIHRAVPITLKIMLKLTATLISDC